MPFPSHPTNYHTFSPSLLTESGDFSIVDAIETKHPCERTPRGFYRKHTLFRFFDEVCQQFHVTLLTNAD